MNPTRWIPAFAAALLASPVIGVAAQELGPDPIDSENRIDPLAGVGEESAFVGIEALPSGFFTEQIAPGYSFTQPVGVTFSSDGRIFVVEKRGRVYVVENGVKLSTPLINLEAEVLNHWDRGLLGFALDPDFATNGRVYLLYTYDRDGSGDYQRQDAAARLTRYTVSTANPNLVDVSTRKVLIGQTFPEAIPSCFYSHTIGTLQFGSDGTLLVGAGDGADFNQVDPGGLHPTCFGAGLFPPSENIGAFRAQRLQSLAGKILRVDPETGFGVPSNPFYTGNAADNASRVWALGLRNPYRFTLRKDGSTNPADGQPGTLFIGDVGWSTWEDLHTSTTGGENFGWPCYEGPMPHSSYQNQVPAATYCSSPPFLHDVPTYYWHHSNTALSSPTGQVASAIVGGDIYQGYRYPSGYGNRLFFADYTRGWISSAAVSSGNALSDYQQFGTSLGAVVDVRFDPVSSYLYWVNVSSGQVYRLRHNNENAPPIAVASATPLDGYAPLNVQFTGSSSSDPNSDPLTYLWDFGDGSTSTLPDPAHTFTTGGVFQVSLTVSDNRNASDFAFLEIAVNNTYPKAIILSPANGASFDNTQTVVLTATGIDAEDPPSNLSYDWLVAQRHNTHSHSDFFADTGQSANFALSQHGLPTEVSYLEIQLIVTDTGGLTDTSVHYIEIRRPGEIDITTTGIPTASVTSPTGSGNPNIGVIADGVMPDTSDADPLKHYDTFDGTAKSADWIGYTFTGHRHLSKLILQQGVQAAGGGWFDSLAVEVRANGVWTPVSYLNAVRPYEGNSGVNFDQYTLLFEAMWGDGIRVAGVPGGSGNYISVGELRVFGLSTPAFGVDKRSGVAPLAVQFTDMSTIENPTALQWDFGDGSTGFGNAPSHTYEHDGSYTATLTVHSLDGYYTERRVGYIVVGSPGILGEYYDGANFTGTRLMRVDPSIDFSWGSGSPDASMGPDEFSIRWSGWVKPEYAETYTFYTTTDDGVRLWVGNELVVDQWIDQAPTERSGTIPLAAGDVYPIRMEYYEHGGGADAHLEWQSPSRSRQVIPSNRLIAKSLAPVVTSYSPGYGEFGTQVTLTGWNLGGMTAVSFNGMQAASKGVGSASAIWADVPIGSTSGPIEVTTPDGTAVAGIFYVNDNVLALEIADLNAVVSGKKANLQWRALNANGVDYFVVETRPSSDQSFQTVGAVRPAGKDGHYDFPFSLDRAGAYVVRLMIVDKAGEQTYSEEVDINATLSALFELDGPYPNPFRESLTIGLSTRDQQRVRVAVYDLLGRLQDVAFDEMVAANEYQMVSISNLDDLASGVYVVRVQGELFVTDHQVIKVR